jgi:hypothetical protein
MSLLRRLFTLHGSRATRIAAFAVVIAGFAAPAYAYFSAGVASGSAGATTAGSLTAATISAPASTSGTITLTWSAQSRLTGSANSSITYTVERKNGVNGAYAALTSGGCSGTLAYSFTSCTDQISAGGSYYYHVIAHFHSWTAATADLGPNADSTAPNQPTLGSVASPIATTTANGATLTNLTATGISDNTGGSGVANVAYFYCAGTCSSTPDSASATWTQIGTSTTSTGSYPVTWSSPSLPDGTYSVIVRTQDNAGNDSFSSVKTTTVDNTPPSGSITSPSAGTIGGTVSLTSNATDAGSGVASVSYAYCSGTSCTPSTVIGTSTSGSTYPVSWDTSTLANGPYVLRATKTDKVGNASTTSTLTVTISNTYTFAISSVGTQTAGTAFGGFTVQLQLNGTRTGSYRGSAYTGGHTISFSGSAMGVAPDGTAATPTSTSLSFNTSGQATAGAALMTLYNASTGVSVVATDSTNSIAGTSDTFNVNAGTAARLAWTTNSVSASTAYVCTTPFFSCSWSGANNATFTFKVSVTDTHGNIVQSPGSGHSITVASSGSDGTPASQTLSLPATGAWTTTQATWVAPHGSWTADTLTAADTTDHFTSASLSASK